jgi:hypothetical protein
MGMTKMEALLRGGFDAFMELAGRWELSTEKAMGSLGIKSAYAFDRWRNGEGLDIPKAHLYVPRFC